MSEKEERIRALTRLYYSQPKVQEALFSFAPFREVVPRYFEGFGKRPDMLQYPSDIMGLVNKGATSFHASEELWNNPLDIQTELTPLEMNSLRKGWDLLIDIDSPFLDCSKIAAQLIVKALEQHGIENYGIKFSGSKGFHIMLCAKAFPETFDGQITKDMFPIWPRAISRYLMSHIRQEYNMAVGKILSETEVEKRTKLTKEDMRSVVCLQCNGPASKGGMVRLKCNICGLTMNRRDVKLTKRRLRCVSGDCAGILEVEEEKMYYFCERCKDPENERMPINSDKNPELFEQGRGVNAEKVANLDLVLVAPRHLFRMPYSLHEKTALSSITITKDQLKDFSPRDADPLRVKIIPYLPANKEGEATRLLSAALSWARNQQFEEEVEEKKTYDQYQQKYEKIALHGVREEFFPPAIKKLLGGLADGKKRGLFILITFLRTLNFSPEYMQIKIREWNARNEPPLKEGYVRSQIDWHLRQKKQILPPNYENPSFYRDLGLIDKKQDSKNPIVDVMREMRRHGLLSPAEEKNEEANPKKINEHREE